MEISGTWHVDRGILFLIFSLLVIFSSIILAKKRRHKLIFNLSNHHNKHNYNKLDIFAHKAGIFFSYFSIIAACLLLFLSAMGISKVDKINILKSEKENILFVLDISPSMSAEDINEISRWNAVKQAMKFLLDREPNKKIGIVLFSNSISMVSPFTEDYNFLKKLIDNITLGSLGDNTAIAEALLFAYNIYFSHVDSNTKIVLVTDGNNNSGNISLTEVSKYIKRISDKVSIIHVGTNADTKFKYIDKKNNKIITGILKPTKQNLIQDFADASNISYYGIFSTEQLERYFFSLLDMNPKNSFLIEKNIVVDKTNVIVLIAGIFFLLHIIIRHLLLRVLW